MFEAKQPQAQWQVVYERLQLLQINDVITDDALRSLLPEAPWNSVVTAFHRAAKEMLAEHLRAFERVRTVGYRMVQPREQERLALGQHKKARRRNKAAKALATNVDHTQLTSDERRRLAAVEDHLVRVDEMMNRLSRNQLKHDRRIAVTEKDSAALTDRLDRLTEMLRRHGIQE